MFVIINIKEIIIYMKDHTSIFEIEVHINKNIIISSKTFLTTFTISYLLLVLDKLISLNFVDL